MNSEIIHLKNYPRLVDQAAVLECYHLKIDGQPIPCPMNPGSENYCHVGCEQVDIQLGGQIEEGLYLCSMMQTCSALYVCHFLFKDPNTLIPVEGLHRASRKVLV